MATPSRDLCAPTTNTINSQDSSSIAMPSIPSNLHEPPSSPSPISVTPPSSNFAPTMPSPPSALPPQTDPPATSSRHPMITRAKYGIFKPRFNGLGLHVLYLKKRVSLLP
ncbi:hypothetical protein L2E82_52433 [Cichorium intybus]|nr:hypothetical protein L2E82_52433 [Cichorium intybus]